MRAPRILLKPRELLALAGFLVLPQLAGALGAAFTFRSLAEWYPFIGKSPLTPPSWVFGPVWTTLFVLMGVAAFLVWRREADGRAKRVAYAVFGAQLALNAAWSVAFFGMRAPGAGLVVVAALALAIAGNIAAFRPVSRTAAVLLIPYLSWVLFASYLNLEVFLRN